MKLEDLEKANNLVQEIEKCKENIRGAKYTQAEKVVIRETLLKVYGVDTEIEVPASLFRTIGKLILVEYTQKLAELEKELENL
jgi:hypothetical protein